jgi:short-subunit dehydrogenase
VSRRKIQGLQILLTGASSGIGRALAKQLFERGASIIVTARREERLKALQDELLSANIDKTSLGRMLVCSGDITNADFRQELVQLVTSEWGKLDVLMNNAGAGALGEFASAKPERLRSVMELDFFAPVELTRLMLPLLRAGQRPAIVNVGSVLSHRAVPMKSEYCAAKFALRGWSEALRCELLDDGIEVLQASPSTTKSEFFDALVDSDAKIRNVSVGAMPAEQVAEIIVASLARSRREVIISWGGKALVWAGQFFPGLTDRILARFANQKP